MNKQAALGWVIVMAVMMSGSKMFATCYTNAEGCVECGPHTNGWSGTCPSANPSGSVTPTTVYVCYSNAPVTPTNIIFPGYPPTNIFTRLITYDCPNGTNVNVTNTVNVTYGTTVVWTNFSSPYTNFPGAVTNTFSADCDAYVGSSDTNRCAAPGLVNLGRVTWYPEAVTSLTPSAGTWVDDGDNDPNTATYLVQVGCNATITVTAADSLGLNVSALPSCWTMSGGTEIDKKNHSVDGNTVGKTEIDVSCGASYQKIIIIVYQAKFEIDADRGDCFLDDVGHSWWNLSVQPSDVYQFLKKTDGTILSGRLGTAGYYGDGSIYCTGDTGCPGQVKFGQQPNSSGGFHTATGSHWWCISFVKLIGALTYVDDLAEAPGTYYLLSNNCTRQAEEVEGIAGAPVGYTGIYPCALSDYLNTLPASTCSCGQ